MEDVCVEQNSQFASRIGVRVLLMIAMLSANGQAQPHAGSVSAEPVPEPAVSAILAAFDRYDVVGMPAGHGLKDLNDLILTLVRNPTFWKKVHDIEIECGNSLYQDVLDRYTSGADVAFREVQKVWRNTSQPMCGVSGFYEQIVPLVRAINQRLPRGKGLRVLGGDPPFGWDQIKAAEDKHKAVLSRHKHRLSDGEGGPIETSQGPDAHGDLSPVARRRRSLRKKVSE